MYLFGSLPPRNGNCTFPFDAGEGGACFCCRVASRRTRSRLAASSDSRRRISASDSVLAAGSSVGVNCGGHDAHTRCPWIHNRSVPPHPGTVVGTCSYMVSPFLSVPIGLEAHPSTKKSQRRGLPRSHASSPTAEAKPFASAYGEPAWLGHWNARRWVTRAPSVA